MSPQVLGLIIGGLIPALLFSLNGLLNKLVTQTGTGVGWLLLLTGIGVAASSIPFFILLPSGVSSRGVGFSLLMGITWGLGVGLIAVAILKFRSPLSQLVPLYNMNTLFVVLLSLLIFAEWKSVGIFKLVVGAMFVLVGGTLVALA